MRQLKNKHYDTKEGASGFLAEIVSSTSSSLVSKQKDENKMQLHELLPRPIEGGK